MEFSMPSLADSAEAGYDRACLLVDSEMPLCLDFASTVVWGRGGKEGEGGGGGEVDYGAEATATNRVVLGYEDAAAATTYDPKHVTVLVLGEGGRVGGSGWRGWIRIDC